MTGGERRSEPDQDGAAGAAPDSPAVARPDEAPVAPERPRRTPPTIDATATELTEPAADEPAPPPPEPPAGEFQPGSARDFLSGDSATAVDDKTGGGAPRGGFSLGMLAAGFAGGLVVLLVLFVLWLTGLVPIRYAGSTAMRARVAVLEMQVQELANRPATGAKAREELAQRLDKVEQALAQPPQAQAQAATPDPALEQRLAAAEAALTSLGNRVDAGAARIEAAEKAATDAAAKADHAAHDTTAAAPDPALVARLDAAAREAAAAQATMQATMQTAMAGAAAEGTRIKAALAALALRDGALSGRPFAAELAAAKSLGVDAAALAALEPFAAAGVPGEAALAQELTPLLPALRKTSKAPSVAEPAPAQGFLDRLEANASRLIRIRPVGEAATGSDPAAVIARAGTLAAKPDVAGAAAALKTLPADLRAPADQWIARVAARQAAREAAGGLAAMAARLLGPS